jgi:hypothetical protein
LVTAFRVGNQKHYQANRASPVFNDLCNIVRQTVGLHDPIREALAPLETRIVRAVLYGSVAKQTDTAMSDIGSQRPGTKISQLRWLRYAALRASPVNMQYKPTLQS